MKTNLDALEVLLDSLINEMEDECDTFQKKIKKAEEQYPDTWGFEDPEYEMNCINLDEEEQMLEWIKTALDVVQLRRKNYNA